MFGCAGNNVATQKTSAESQFRDLAARHSTELVSHAALLRVKVKRDRRIDDFRVEIFSRQGGDLSLYVRGFLGTAVFKAVISGDLLTCYFPREKRFFSGQVEDLETGSLMDSRHIIAVLLNYYRGGYELPEGGMWERHVVRTKRAFDIQLTDSVHRLRFDSKIMSNPNKFPFLRMETIRLESSDQSFMANIAVQSSSFNRAIPDEKFELQIPDGAFVMTSQDLAELLTNLAQ